MIPVSLTPKPVAAKPRCKTLTQFRRNCARYFNSILHLFIFGIGLFTVPGIIKAQQVSSGSSSEKPAVPSASTTPPESTSAAVQSSSSNDSVAVQSLGQTPSANVVVNLINRLVKRGVLSKEDAEDLVQQAQIDAEKAKAMEKNVPKKSETDSISFSDKSDSSSGDEQVNVTYIPEFVKDQMREEIKQQVLKQAKEEKWAAPNTVPDWVSRFRFIGDFRGRYEGDYFPAGNDHSGTSYQFVNFNTINTGAPIDASQPLTGLTYPRINVDTERQRERIRARFGAEVDLADRFVSGFRLGTGENNSPVSENQSLGVANQSQGGNFSRYAIWLDRAFLKYQPWSGGGKDLSFSLGRFDNPFFGTTMMWANDLAFDGISAKAKYQIDDNIKPFLNLGVFPVFNNDLNFSSNQPAKFKSRDKWLAAIQGGTELKLADDLTMKVAAGYFDFQNIEGRTSRPIGTNSSSDQSDADDSRPSFAQKGNTYMFIRKNIVGFTDFQYFGLATPFRDFDAVVRIDYTGFDPFNIWVVGDYVQNLALDSNRVNAIAVNNLNTATNYEGGNEGWLVNLNIGKPALEKFGDWNVGAGYRYVESDAVIDGFCDSDFGGGGTNLKGYTLGGNLALGSHVWCSVTYMSANSIAGPRFREDIVQLDINARF